MTATNIILDDLIKVLVTVRNSKVEVIEMDIVPDDKIPGVNKLIIRPVTGNSPQNPNLNAAGITIRNPAISPDDDIQTLFEGLI